MDEYDPSQSLTESQRANRVQHSDMYEYGETASTVYSIDAMRRQAKLRLEREGWTTVIHRHVRGLPCGDDPDWDECEAFFPEEDDQ